jgi:hypothetical protein
MERLRRKPFQGITNIIRFNWHYYVIAFMLITLLYFVKNFLPSRFAFIPVIITLLAIAGIFISLIISWYIYDHSDLYSFNWANALNIDADKRMANISAGFDETSSILSAKYPGSQLLVFDFYDPARHTEISIKRAREAYPAFPGTITTSTTHVPLKEKSVDYILLILSAHEIRDSKERVDFFLQLKKALADNGRIIVTEHQRDIYNFLAYNFGFFHFLSGRTWKQTFEGAGLSESLVLKTTPFISTFILTKNGTAP